MLRYSELANLKTFDERFVYLQLHGTVGVDTFGFDRYVNQMFYKSDEWIATRNKIIIRDNGCDLGIEGFEIYDRIIIHHINPITLCDIQNGGPSLFDPENLICVSDRTHKALHYGTIETARVIFADRKPGDTCPWKT